MTAAMTLMAKDRKGPAIAYQVLFIPATDARNNTDSYHEFATGPFLSRAFMEYGWNLYAPDQSPRSNPYVSPLRASKQELQGLPPALVIAAKMIRSGTKARPTRRNSRTRASPWLRLDTTA